MGGGLSFYRKWVHNNAGASASIATKYFKKNIGRSFDAMYAVKKPDNWTPVFDLANAEEVAENKRKADEKIDDVIRKIQMGVNGEHVNDKLGKFVEVVYPLAGNVSLRAKIPRGFLC